MKPEIKVLIKRAGKDPTMEVIRNTLPELQRIVGGYIETFTLERNIVVIFDEEGYLKQLPYTAHVAGIMLRGPLIFAGVSGDELTDVPLHIGGFRHMFPQLWEVNEDGNN